MKRLYTLLLLVPFVLSAQLRDSVKIKTSIYEVCYSEKLESPLRVTYTVQCPTGTASRVGMDFYTEKNVHTSDNADYANNVYDKGHMAPAADFNCTKEMLKQEKKIKRKAPDGITLDGEYPFVGNLKKMYENAVQGQQQQVQQIGAKVGQQAADTLMPITPVNNVQKNKPNQNQYNDFNAYQQDLTDWEKENNQRSDYKGDTVEKDGIAVVQMTDKELKNPSKQQWGNHLAKPTPPKNERKSTRNEGLAG